MYREELKNTTSSLWENAYSTLLTIHTQADLDSLCAVYILEDNEKRRIKLKNKQQRRRERRKKVSYHRTNQLKMYNTVQKKRKETLSEELREGKKKAKIIS